MSTGILCSLFSRGPRNSSSLKERLTSPKRILPRVAILWTNVAWLCALQFLLNVYRVTPGEYCSFALETALEVLMPVDHAPPTA